MFSEQKVADLSNFVGLISTGVISDDPCKGKEVREIIFDGIEKNCSRNPNRRQKKNSVTDFSRKFASG
jgi:hypothetical protein